MRCRAHSVLSASRFSSRRIKTVRLLDSARLLNGARYGSIACSELFQQEIPIERTPDPLTDLAGRNSKPSEAGREPEQ